MFYWTSSSFDKLPGEADVSPGTTLKSKSLWIRMRSREEVWLGCIPSPPHFVPFLLWGKCSEYTGMVTTATRWLVILPLRITCCLSAVCFLFDIKLIHITAPAPLINGPEVFPLKQHNRPYWQQLLRRQLRNFSSALSWLLLSRLICAVEFPLHLLPVGVGLCWWHAVSGFGGNSWFLRHQLGSEWMAQLFCFLFS